MNEKLVTLSKGRSGKILIEVLEDILMEVADIRKPLNVAPAIANDVRFGVIQVLEEKLIGKLKAYSGELDPPDLNEHI